MIKMKVREKFMKYASIQEKALKIWDKNLGNEIKAMFPSFKL